MGAREECTQVAGEVDSQVRTGLLQAWDSQRYCIYFFRIFLFFFYFFLARPIDLLTAVGMLGEFLKSMLLKSFSNKLATPPLMFQSVGLTVQESPSLRRRGKLEWLGRTCDYHLGPPQQRSYQREEAALDARCCFSSIWVVSGASWVPGGPPGKEGRREAGGGR